MLIAVCVLIILLGVLAYFRCAFWNWALGIAIWVAAVKLLLGFPNVLIGILIVIAAIFLIAPVRLTLISQPLFRLFKKITPKMSSTEEEAIQAGTVWWDRELFSGKPNWNHLHTFPCPRLTPEEEAFLDGPVETLCSMLDEWKIIQHDKDLPPEAWAFIKNHGFLGMIIEKKYGGLAFSNYAHTKVVRKIASRSGTAAISVMVPNSLGPGELLQHYGTEAQKAYYLPRLAKGEEIPCFALTSPFAGSDAGSIPDYGIVCTGNYTHPRTEEHHEGVLGIRLSWEKRWITLAPIATLLGLAFKLYDPEHLLGSETERGITCALIPTDHAGVVTGSRHYPPGCMFMNGPTWGKEVFIPIDWIIGGPEYAGQGWRMLVECLSVGRCISLPAIAVTAGKMAVYTTGAYARIRDQFGLSIGRFEGVDEAMARIGGLTYQMEAAQNLALTGLDMGEKPSVLAAIIKYHNTERMRKVVNDAMDVHGGRAVVMGPRNYLANAYHSIPIAITVEGANILTRSMIIYGQGAIRSHPFVFQEMQAAKNNNLKSFDRGLRGHFLFFISNAIRAFWLGLTGGRWVHIKPALASSHTVRRYYQKLTADSSAFAFLSDVALFTLGSKLKFKEKLSARLGDCLSNLYIASACLKQFSDNGQPQDELPLLAWAVETALYDFQQAMSEFLRNLPNRLLRGVIRFIVMPRGLTRHQASDQLGTQVSTLMMEIDHPARQRLTSGIFAPNNMEEPTGLLNATLRAAIETEALELKLRKLKRAGKLVSITAQQQLAEALHLQFITNLEYKELTRARHLKRQIIMVDEFNFTLTETDPGIVDRQIL